MTALKLYGIPPQRATRPIWALNALGLECEIVALDPLNEGDAKTVASLNPSGKLPILVDGELVLIESVAISLHLCEVHGGGRFIPTEPAERALMHQFLFFLVTEIEQPLWRAALHEVIYEQSERRPEEMALAMRDARRELVRIENWLEGRTFFINETMSVVDFIAAFTLDWADEQSLLDASPNCRRYVETIYEDAAAPPRIEEAFAALHAGTMPPRYRGDLRADLRIGGNKR